MKLISISIFFILAINSACAANRFSSTTYKIKNIVFYSNNETVFPAWSGTVAIYPETPIVWNETTSCELGAVVIRQGDSHLLSAVLTAYSTSKSVKFYTDDSQKVEGNFCFLRAIGYQ